MLDTILGYSKQSKTQTMEKLEKNRHTSSKKKKGKSRWILFSKRKNNNAFCTPIFILYRNWFFTIIFTTTPINDKLIVTDSIDLKK